MRASIEDSVAHKAASNLKEKRMSERRFVICETGEAWNGELGKEVTESELKRRLREIIYANWNEEACIDILLHKGDEK